MSAEDTFARKLNEWSDSRETLPLNMPSTHPNMFMDFIQESNNNLSFGDYHDSVHKRWKLAEQKVPSCTSSTSGDLDAIEMRRLAAKKKRAEVREKVNWKWAWKEAEKWGDHTEDIKENETKKKDTIWKIIMPDKRWD